MFRALTFNPSRKSLWGLGKRVLCSGSDPRYKEEKACTKDDDKMSSFAEIRLKLVRAREQRIAPKDVKVHSSEIGKAIGLSRVGFWLDLIRKPPPSSSSSGSFIPFSDYRKLAKALERYKRLFTKANVKVKPIALESLSSADPRDDLVYKIEDHKKILLLVKCPDLHEPYEELPMHYVLQAQALIALSDAAAVHVYCWTKEGSSLFLISRDAVLWRQVSLAVRGFWEDHVEPGRKLYKSDMVDPLVELVDLVPSDRHRDFEDIRERCMLIPDVDRIFYEVSLFYLWLCERSEEEDNHFPPNQLLVDRKSYHMFEAPIATRFKRGDLNISDILYLGVTMYDHQHKKIPVSLDDTLLSYILHCETLSCEDERLKGASFWSSNPPELFTEAIYHALLRELVKHSQNPDFSYLLRTLKVEAAARIKSGDLSADTFLFWTKP